MPDPNEGLDRAGKNPKAMALGSAVIALVLCVVAFFDPMSIRRWLLGIFAGALVLRFALSSVDPENSPAWLNQAWVGRVLLGTLLLIPLAAVGYVIFGLYATWQFLMATDPEHGTAPFWLTLALSAVVIFLAWAYWRTFFHAQRWQRGARKRMNAAHSEDPQQWYDLGCHYLNGTHGLRKDESAARHWLLKAARANHREAMTLLAELLDQGLGGPKDAPSASEWRARALH